MEIAATVPVLDVFNMSDERRRSALWKSTAQLRRRLMQRAAVSLNRAFRAQLKQVVEAINTVQTTGEIGPAAAHEIDRTVKLIEKPLFDIDLKTAPLFAVQSYLSIKRMAGKQELLLPDFTSRVRRHIQEQGAEKVRKVQEVTKKRIRDAIDRALSEPGQYPSGEERPPSIRDIAKRILVDVPISQMSRNRSLVIAHTETIRSSNFGSLMGAKDAAQLVGLQLDKVWISTKDTATRRIEPPFGRNPKFDHVVMDGKTTGIDGVFLVPMSTGAVEPLEYPGAPGGSAANVINCFVGETFVRATNIEMIFRSRYSGEFVTIKTARGNEITGTPNHPILSPRGFVPLGRLVNGSTLLSCTLRQESSFCDPDVDNRPVMLKEIFDSFAKSFRVERIPRVDVNFYGDRPTSDIDVIRPIGNLEKSFDAKFFQPRSKKNFSRPNMGQVSHSRYRGLFQFAHRNSPTAHFSMSRFCKFQSFSERQSFHSENIGLRYVAQGQSNFPDPPFDGVASDMIFLGQREDGESSRVVSRDFASIKINASTSHDDSPTMQTKKDASLGQSETSSDLRTRFPSSIEIDHVIDVQRRTDSSRHVFTLQVDGGIYGIYSALAIGSMIFAHNCRCTIGYQEAVAGG